MLTSKPPTQQPGNLNHHDPSRRNQQPGTASHVAAVMESAPFANSRSHLFSIARLARKLLGPLRRPTASPGPGGICRRAADWNLAARGLARIDTPGNAPNAHISPRRLGNLLRADRPQSTCHAMRCRAAYPRLAARLGSVRSPLGRCPGDRRWADNGRFAQHGTPRVAQALGRGCANRVDRRLGPVLEEPKARLATGGRTHTASPGRSGKIDLRSLSTRRSKLRRR